MRAAIVEYETKGSVSSKTLTVAAWLDRWLTDIVKPTTKPRTYDWYSTKVNSDISPRIGKVLLAALTPDQVRKMLKDIAKDGRVSTARGAHRTLRAALNAAMADGYVMRNVASLITPPASTAKEREVLSLDEAKKVLAATDRYAVRWALALFTGARQGESLGLGWDRVNLADETLDISWQLQRLKFAHGCNLDSHGEPKKETTCGKTRAGSCPKRFFNFNPDFEYRILHGGIILSRPKTNKGTRIIPMPPALTAMLKRHRLATMHEPNPHNLVWHEETGTPVDPSNDTERWDAVLKSVGVKDVPLHNARHTTATLLMSLKVDPMIIKAILGHSEVTTTQGYMHVDLSLAREAMGRLGGELS